MPRDDAAAAPPPKDRIAAAIGDGIGRVSNLTARRPLVTLALVALITAGLGSGLVGVEFEENLLEILPRDHPDTLANLNLSRDFPGHHSYVNINFKADPEKWEAGNGKLPHRVDPATLHTQGPMSTEPSEHVGKDNITDEVYLRGLEEFYQDWVRDPKYLPPGVDVFNVAWNAHVKLINYTNSFDPSSCQQASSGLTCLDPEAYRFPCAHTRECAVQFAEDWKTVYAAAPNEVTTQASPDWQVTRSVYVYTPIGGHKLDYNDIGARFHQAFLDYMAAAERGELEWNVFDFNGTGITDAKIVDDAHGSALAQEDLKVLGPIVAAFILVTLFVAFRSAKAVAVAMGSLVVGTVWTYGTMGHLGIPLNTLNLTVVPLILGVGIDYSIHMTREYLEHKSEGHTDARAFMEAGRRSGFAMLLATVTTIAGLLIVAVSPSLLIAQMGLLSAIALAFTFLLSITLIPAGLVLARLNVRKEAYRPSRLMPRMGALVSGRRASFAVAFVVVSAMLLSTAQGVRYESFGNPALNFPEGDRLRDWYEQGQASFFGTESRAFESNWVILEGDLTTPAAHRYIMALQERLRANPEIRDDSVTGITNLVLQWEQLKRGTPVAVGVLGMGELHKGTGERSFDPYPQTREDLRQSLDEMYACPCFRTYASLFINPDYTMSVILIDTRTGGTYDGAKAIMDQVHRTLDAPDLLEMQEDANLRTSVGGYTAFSVLFIETQMPWVTYMALASLGLVVAILLVVWRDVRATLAIAALVLLTTVWWLGTLPLLGIGLAVTLTLPLVFINCIGSDYGLHLVWAAKQDGQGMRRVLENTGKAVLFSVITTAGSFALFIPMTNLMMRRSMIATAVAIAAIFVVTVLIVPLFYHVDGEAAPPEALADTPEEEAPPA